MVYKSIYCGFTLCMKLFHASKVYLFDLEASDFIFEGERGLDKLFSWPKALY